MSGLILGALVAACVVRYLSYGHRVTRELRERNAEMLRRRLHKTVSMQVFEGKFCWTVTGRIEEVGAHQVTIRDQHGRRSSVPLTSVRTVRAASRN